MGIADVGAIVAGAGVAGLAAALELQASGREVLVVDASDRPGGVMRTDHVSGYVIERGPNTMMVKAPMLGLLERLHAEEQLLAAQPAGKLHFIYADGKLRPVPASPRALLGTSLLSGRAKWRLLSEPLRRRGDGAAESVAEFVERRLGGEVSSHLVGPFLTGVYAGDERALGAEAVFPSLVEAERRAGSIALGLVGGLFARKERGLRGSYSTAKGLGPFARSLAERLAEPPALSSRVTGVRRDGDAWMVFVSGPGGEQRLRAPHVVLAVGADQAAEILRGIDSGIADALASIEYAPIVTAPLGVAPADVRREIEGFGFLVPRDAGLSLLGCLFMSQLFPSRAPAGHELLHCMLGGVRWREAVDLPDDVLLERLCADLDQSLGLREQPRALGFTRWPRAIPQPGRHHVRLIADVRAKIAVLPGLSLAGSYLDGVAVSDALASGLRAAADVERSA